MDALLVSPYLGPEMHILIPRVASRHIPEAEAVCGSSARTDLCGGRQVTAVPTATMPVYVLLIDSFGVPAPLRRAAKVLMLCSPGSVKV